MTTEEQGLIDRAMVQLSLLQERQSTALFRLPDLPHEAREELQQAGEHLQLARRALRLAGAHIPALDDRPTEDRYDLAELAAMDSEIGHALLERLDEIHELAERYDGERGKMVAGSGSDIGESVALLRLRLRLLLGVGK